MGRDDWLSVNFLHVKVLVIQSVVINMLILWILVSLPNDKISDCSKLKAFADDKINVTEKLKFVLRKVNNIVGKAENAGYQRFLFVPQSFQKPSFSRSLKVGLMR